MKKITSIGGMEFQVIVDGVDVNLVWETRRGERQWSCGAAISGNAEAVHGWATLVDGFSGSAEASS